MTRIFGFLVGIVWLVLAGVAYRYSAAGWSADASDLGFWWAVVAAFLTIAAGAAFIGTWLHTRPQHGVVHPVERGAQH
jgi:hypothetical protein